VTQATLEQARSAKKSAHDAFSRLADVVGVGIARRGAGYALKVNVRSALPAGVAVPTDILGVPVEVEVVGALRKRGES
jgi:hypothetical protein